MGYTYEDYLRKMMQEAQKEQQAYEASRRAQADNAAAAVDREYAAIKQRETATYQREAKEEAAAYRSMLDAHAVDELVARREIAEAVANTNLANSGLNNTRQTAISLQRSRADAATRAQRQQAVQAIMRKLDDLRADYDARAAKEKNAIYADAEEDVQQNLFSLSQSAKKQAQSMYEAQAEREHEASESGKLRAHDFALLEAKNKKEEDNRSLTEKLYNPSKHGTRFADESNIPSITAIRVDATNILRREGNNAAWAFLKQRVKRGYIKETIMYGLMHELGIKQPVPPSDAEVANTVNRFLRQDKPEEAMRYIESLNNAYLMDIRTAYDWYLKIGMEPD